MTLTTSDAATTDWEGFQYDSRDPRIEYWPFDIWRRLRNEQPIIHSDRYDGFWFVSRYEDAKRIQRDWRTFTSREGVTIPKHEVQLLPGEVDPPVHQKYREILTPVLAKEAIAKNEPWIRSMARDWLSKIEDDVAFDLCTDYCEPFAKHVALRVIGFAEADLPKLAETTSILGQGLRHDDEGQRATVELVEILTRSLRDRAQAGQVGDVLSAIAFGEIDGSRMPEQDQMSLLFEVTFGGLHTTSAVMAGALVWLADHPKDRTRLLEEPDLIDTAIEEFARFVSPVSHFARVATKDTEVAGQRIAAGDKVMYGLASANRDERVFENPDEVVLDRTPNPHLAFGFGPHRCAGSNLGLLGVKVGVEEFLKTFRSFKVSDYYGLRWSGGEGRALLAAPFVSRRA